MSCNICGEQICHLAVEKGAKKHGGAGVFLVYNDKVVLGKERSGSYRGKFNIGCGGNKKGECCLQTALREFKEEIKLYISFNDFVNNCIGVIVYNCTAVFILSYPYDINNLDEYVKEALDPNAKWKDEHWYLQEMETIQEFSVAEISENISSFTLALMNKYNNKNYFKINK